MRLRLAIPVLAACLLVVSARHTVAQTAPVNSKDPAPVKQYHDGSIRDLEAIGSRNVGCGRGMGNWFTIEKQIAMGKDYAHQVEATASLISDPIVTEYINRIGQNLVRNSDSEVPFTIKVLDSD